VRLAQRQALALQRHLRSIEAIVPDHTPDRAAAPVDLRRDLGEALPQQAPESNLPDQAQAIGLWGHAGLLKCDSQCRIRAIPSNSASEQPRDFRMIRPFSFGVTPMSVAGKARNFPRMASIRTNSLRNPWPSQKHYASVIQP
jgi:hypothetical protein